MIPKLMAHGGAWDWDDRHDEEKRDGLQEALAAGYAILQRGGSALDAVERTVIALEDNPIFDAGTGGYLNQEGVVQLDALIVDGSGRNFGAVGGVTRVRNPITLARRIMAEMEPCFFVGDGADRLAEKLGIEVIANEVLITPAMRDFYLARRTDGPSDTVGAVALDKDGRTAAATSTSGTPFKPAGRVGDSPLYGAGGYAEDGCGAIGATGKGEQIMRLLLSKVVADRLGEGLTAGEAAAAAMRPVEALFSAPMAGVIVIDRHGRYGAAHTTPKMAYGWVDEAGKIYSQMRGSP